MSDKKITIVVPARLESQRLKKKLLLSNTGKPLIVHTLENLKPLSELANIFLVTDSEEIKNVSKNHCDEVYFSTVECKSGTERICNMLDKIHTDWVLNVQADEPEIDVEDLKKLIASCTTQSDKFEMATIGSKFTDAETFQNPNAVKVVVDKNNKAMYFSRSVIPHSQNFNCDGVYHHIGIYAYKIELLKRWNSLPEGILEKEEKLEQLRALENSISILVKPVSCAHKGIDTQEDYDAFTKRELKKVNVR